MEPNAKSVAGASPDARARAGDQPVGELLQGWQSPARPRREVLRGRFCRLEPLDPAKHAQALFEANTASGGGAANRAAGAKAPSAIGAAGGFGANDAMWTYLAYGPFADFASYRGWMERAAGGEDPLFFAVVEQVGGSPLGVAAYLRIDPANGVIEIGHLAWSPALQRTAAATEALYLLLAHVFELGYRRCEWKCDSLNAPSRAAAVRLGFVFEGIFRQAVVVKGRNRDTAWFSMLDSEWPARRAAFERWLAPENSDATGRQRKALGAFLSSTSDDRDDARADGASVIDTKRDGARKAGG